MSALAAAGFFLAGMLTSCVGVAPIARIRRRTCAAPASPSHVDEHRIVAAAVAFGTAACESVAALRGAIATATCEAVPEADGVLIYEERDGALVCVAASGERFAYYGGTALSLNDETALPARAIARGHHVRLGDGARALHPADADAVALRLSLASGRLCAVAVAVAARTLLDDAAVARLITLADLASPAYRIAQEREDDRHRAEYDGLTGLLTPRAFRHRLGTLVDRTRRLPGGSLALVFVDTDHFKHWNDSCGHAAGDTLLRAIAAVLRGFATDRDLVARNGGDEFCLVFAETDKASAIERAERLRARIAAVDSHAAEIPARRPPGETGRITASIGVAAFPADATTASELLERADAAMYHSKETGRDGVSYAGLDGTLTRLAR